MQWQSVAKKLFTPANVTVKPFITLVSTDSETFMTLLQSMKSTCMITNHHTTCNGRGGGLFLPRCTFSPSASATAQPPACHGGGTCGGSGAARPAGPSPVPSKVLPHDPIPSRTSNPQSLGAHLLGVISSVHSRTPPPPHLSSQPIHHVSPPA